MSDRSDWFSPGDLAVWLKEDPHLLEGLRTRKDRDGGNLQVHTDDARVLLDRISAAFLKRFNLAAPGTKTEV